MTARNATTADQTTGLFGFLKRELVLCRTIPCGIEAPPVPRPLVGEAQSGRVLRIGLFGDRRPLDGPRERRAADHVPEAEWCQQLPGTQREVGRQEHIGIEALDGEIP